VGKHRRLTDDDAKTPDDDPGARLRAQGLRVTPQRRAILGAFTGAATEHLSADEVHARAAAVVPDLSRGTVYAALAELTELGLLGAVGNPEPVRYETNAADHQHFRCRICLRLYDVDLPAVKTDRLARRGFRVERTLVTVEGVCADCADYDRGLREGARATIDPSTEHRALPGRLAAAQIASPVGDLLLGATSEGLVRLVFADHGDAAALAALARRRTGSNAGRGHLADARAFVDAYFLGEVSPGAPAVDWAALTNASVATLRAVQAIPPGAGRSYDALRDGTAAHGQGLALGTNPLALVVPCHRVTRGREITEAYVGGAERKRWLRRHEQR
jgi:methylated-DNA-[protein]-cysteine S-methyltransferase